MTRHVLVVDDELRFLATVQRVLPHDWSVRPCLGAHEALARVARGEKFDAMMVDVMMPGMDGPSFVQQLPEALARRTLFVTGAALSPEAQRAIARYPERLLEKPFTVTELVEALERIVAENAEASEEALGPGDRASGDDRRAADK